jgi:hypothetical protein
LWISLFFWLSTLSPQDVIGGAHQLGGFMPYLYRTPAWSPSAALRQPAPWLLRIRKSLFNKNKERSV